MWVISSLVLPSFFFALVLLSSAGKALDLEHNPAAIEFFKSFDTSSHLTIIIFLLIGTLITCIVQSSAAVMAITILLCSTGVLPIYLGIALVMGENIGTTATVNLAALGANTQARRAAFAHLLFNVFGVVWVLCLFYPFVDMVCRMVGYDPENTTLSAAQKATILLLCLLCSIHVSMFATLQSSFGSSHRWNVWYVGSSRRRRIRKMMSSVYALSRLES